MVSTILATKTVLGMVIDDALGLHPGIDDYGSDELKATLLQFLGQNRSEG